MRTVGRIVSTTEKKEASTPKVEAPTSVEKETPKTTTTKATASKTSTKSKKDSFTI